MGLDMYLYASGYESKYCKGYKQEGFYPDDLKELQEEIDKRSVPSKETLYKVGYWRKANAIHNWIVDNCAEGEDNCQKIYFSRDQMETLLNLCEEVLNDHNKAEDLLPTCDGFFFGSTEYDDWYFQDIEYTRDLLKKLLSLNCEYDFYYQASW